MRPATTSGTLTLRGHVTLRATSGSVAPSDIKQTLVYFVPKAGNIAPRAGAFTVFTQHHAFAPAAMVIPVGSKVIFTNLDGVRHNEFSVTPGSAFNLGYQAPGQKTAHAFSHPGVVLVGCLVHRSMELDLLVVPTTFVTRLAADGSFELTDLPPGGGTLYVWNPRGRLVASALTLPTTGPINQRIAVIKPARSTQIDVKTQP